MSAERRPTLAGPPRVALALLALIGSACDGERPVGPSDGSPDAMAPARDAEMGMADIGSDGMLGDGMPTDGMPPDAMPPDVMPPDAMPPDQGLFPFDPDPVCDPPGPVIDAMPGSARVHGDAPRGFHVHSEDIDRDGRCEIFAITAAGQPPEVPATRDRTITIFGWSEGDGFVAQGEMQGLLPHTAIDLPGLGTALAGSARFFVDPAQMTTVSSTVGMRLDRPGDPWRFDDQVALFVEARGERLRASYFDPDDTRALDGDGDGRPELLTFSGALLEWRGDHFEKAWDVAEEDPRDEVVEIGGSAAGRVTHGDFDGDGRTELVLTGYAGRGPVGAVEGYPRHARIFENRGDDRYTLITRLPYGAEGPQFGSTGDLDGDGRPEFLFGGEGANCVRFEVWRAVGDDTYDRLWRLDRYLPGLLPTGRGATAFGDLDGDGDDELVIHLGDVVTAWDWDGAAMRQIMAYAIVGDVNYWPVRVCDLDGDGIEEIMFSEMARGAPDFLGPGGVRILSLAR